MAGLWGCRCAWSWRRARLWGFVSKLTLGLLCPRSNTVYSPAAIFEMLRIMRLGAAGKTARELEGLLGAVDAEGDWMGLSPVDDWAYEGHEAALTLGVWFDRAAWPSEGFAAACARPCMACERVDFSDPGAGTAVSNWIDEATGGLLHPALRFDANALAAIVSVLYLKDTWGSSSFRAMLSGHPSTPRRGRCKRSTWLTFGGLRVCDGAFGTVVSRPLSHGASMRFLLPEGAWGSSGFCARAFWTRRFPRGWGGTAHGAPSAQIQLRDHLRRHVARAGPRGIGDVAGPVLYLARRPPLV